MPRLGGNSIEPASYVTLIGRTEVNHWPNLNDAPHAPHDGHIARVGRLRWSYRAPQTRNSRFQAGEPLFDLAHIVLDTADITTDRPQVFENQIFNIISHIGFPIELS